MATKQRRKWSAEVMKHSDALDLKKDVFKSNDPKAIARSLKSSATRGNRRPPGQINGSPLSVTGLATISGKRYRLTERRCS